MDTHWPQDAGTSISEYIIEGLCNESKDDGGLNVVCDDGESEGRHMSIREWRFNDIDISVLGRETNIW